MKKYKLIKEYPGSLKLGTIVEQNSKNLLFFPISLDIPLVSFKALNRNEIENNPEFWEEVIEYPVGTKIYDEFIQSTITKREDGWYKPEEKTGYTDEIIKSNVKRYKIVTNEVIKKPLFTTEDGVEIFEGDELWWVCVLEDNKIHCNDLKYDYEKFNWIEGKPTNSKNYKWFSTKEAAEKYILDNTPCLSIKDIQDIYVSAKEKPEHHKSRDYYKELVEKVKSKKK